MLSVLAVATFLTWCLGCLLCHVADLRTRVDFALMLGTWVVASAAAGALFYFGQSLSGFLTLALFMVYVAVASRMVVPRLYAR
jgi:hypothetical protein